MFNDGYSPHKDMEKNPLDTADDTSCFVVYPGVIFWGCGQKCFHEIFVQGPQSDAEAARACQQSWKGPVVIIPENVK